MLRPARPVSLADSSPTTLPPLSLHYCLPTACPPLTACPPRPPLAHRLPPRTPLPPLPTACPPLAHRLPAAHPPLATRPPLAHRCLALAADTAARLPAPIPLSERRVGAALYYGVACPVAPALYGVAPCLVPRPYMLSPYCLPPPPPLLPQASTVRVWGPPPLHITGVASSRHARACTRAMPFSGFRLPCFPNMAVPTALACYGVLPIAACGQRLSLLWCFPNGTDQRLSLLRHFPVVGGVTPTTSSATCGLPVFPWLPGGSLAGNVRHSCH